MIEGLRLTLLIAAFLCVALSAAAQSAEERTHTPASVETQDATSPTEQAEQEEQEEQEEQAEQDATQSGSEDMSTSADSVQSDDEVPTPAMTSGVDEAAQSPASAPSPTSTATKKSEQSTEHHADVKRSKESKTMPATASQDLSVLQGMGQSFGAGGFSVLPSAHRMQLSLALDQALSVGLADNKIGGHAPIFSAEVLMRLSNENTGTRALWLGAAVKPLGVSKAYPHGTRLAQRGHVIQSLKLIEYRQLETGTLRLSAGVVSQHLGRADTLYWSSLIPGKFEDEALRLFDNALGVSTVYAYKQLYTRIDIGQPIERNVSPFASSDGLRVQATTGWVDEHAKILVGGRMDRFNAVDEQEVNLSWQLSLKRFNASIPVMVYGEIGSITQPDVNEYALGALYAHHELALEFDKVQLRTRYDWIDRDTYFKYDTTHLLRCAMDFQVVKYVNLSAQYRHRWTNSTDRASTENDDVMMFVQLLY